MTASFNILLTSISAKVPWIKAVRHAMEQVGVQGKIIGGDCRAPCIGSYFVDQFWQMPPLEQLSLGQLLAYCRQNQIAALIPSRDGELEYFAQHRDLLQQNGIYAMVSSIDAISTCVDKLKFAAFLQQQSLPGIATSKSLDDLQGNSFAVKEQYGAGSRSIGLDLKHAEAQVWARSLKQPLFQPFIKGEEYSVDLYLDRKGSVHAAVARHRDLIVHGESQITSSIADPTMEQLAATAAEKLGLYGHVLFQLIKDPNGGLHILECNPRFGGASSLSMAMGLESFTWFILECLGQQLPPFVRSPQEKCQVRYPSDLILSR